jgi:hypothetical protein
LEKGDLGGFKNLHAERIYGKRYNTDSHPIGGTGVSPLHLQAELCAYKKLPIDGNCI